MSIRTAMLLTATALLGAASPALSQDHHSGDHRYGPVAEDEAIEWQQHEVVQPLEGEHGRAYVEASELEVYDDSPVHSDMPATRYLPRRRNDEYARDYSSPVTQPEMYRSSAPLLAYSNEDREAWLSDCRIVMRGSDSYSDNARYEDDDDNGGLLGGLLGAVVGGVAGNRIGGSGDRLAGTLIGAGIGGIAGTVIGDAIGSSDDRYERDAAGGWAGEYCEAYLRRYEASGQTGQYGAPSQQIAYERPAAHAPMRNGAMREIVREEWVDVPVEQAVSPTRQRAAPRRAAPEHGKLTRVN